MSLSGRLKTMDLPEVLQWVTMGKKTGALAFAHDKTKVFIYFRDGAIVSSRSNDPTRQLGQFLLFQGKISEPDLKRAFEIHLKSQVILGRILVEENLVARDDVEEALKTRTAEVIYDLFLWDDGYFQFTTGRYKQDDLIPIRMDINSLLFEGIRRKDEWGRIRAVFPGNSTVLALRQGVDLKTLSLTPLQKKLIYLLTLKKTISEIILELHGSAFLVNFELFQLYEKDLVDVLGTAEPPAEANPAQLFDKGLGLMATHRYREAIPVFQEVLRLDPENSWASEQIEQAEAAICREFYQSTPPEKIPYFLIPEAALLQYDFTTEEGFIVSRINGVWDVKSIAMLSPLREIDILRVLEKLVKMQIVDFR
ncbi:MAG: DUF4388 domain-containing protein [Acidobacteriota bacterium]|jgi:hypothetical protein|nr:DUF4388 domain-containing protein [Acidobacteriota bacterium]